MYPITERASPGGGSEATVERLRGDGEVEVGVRVGLGLVREVPQLLGEVHEAETLEGALQKQPVGALFALDTGVEGVGEGVEAVESGAHVDGVVGEALVLGRVAGDEGLPGVVGP